MPRVTLDPFPDHRMPSACGIQPLPQIDVLHRRPACRTPALALPAVHPFGDAVFYIGAIGDNRDFRRLRQRLQRRNRRHQLHPVVGGQTLATLQGAFLHDCSALPRQHQHTPATRAGIARTGAIRISKQIWHGFFFVQILNQQMPRAQR